MTEEARKRRNDYQLSYYYAHPELREKRRLYYNGLKAQMSQDPDLLLRWRIRQNTMNAIYYLRRKLRKAVGQEELTSGTLEETVRSVSLILGTDPGETMRELERVIGHKRTPERDINRLLEITKVAMEAVKQYRKRHGQERHREAAGRQAGGEAGGADSQPDGGRNS